MKNKPILIDQVQKTNYTNQGMWRDLYGRSCVGSFEKVSELYHRMYSTYENDQIGKFESHIQNPEYDIIFIPKKIHIIPEGTTIYETKYNGYTKTRYISTQDEYEIVEDEKNILAFGIVGYVFTKLNPSLYGGGFSDYNYIPKIGTAEFYQYFFDEQFESFKKGRADAWRDDLLDEFLPLHIQRQEDCIPEADELFTYFPMGEKPKVMLYVENYFKYIEQKYKLFKNKSVEESTNALSTMNYKHTVLTSFIENRNQKTPFASYFKSKAKFAEVNYFIEFPDFFNGCLHVIKLYKNEIQNQYQKRLTEGDYLVRSINSGKGMMKDGEHLTDLNDERIQSTLKYFENDKQFVESRGYINNFDFACYLTTTGEITNELFEQEEKLHWYEIEQIEKGILQAQDELMVNFQEENKQNEVPILKDFFLNVNDEDFEQIITMIDKELDISNARTKTIALYTVALQKKGYLSKTINQTKFHKALKEKLGKKIVGRSNFSEKLTEITSGHYEKELEQYKNKLP